ncbi:MAG: (2Fe-2S)-binding protein [Deltaproteobacteria bacterium]|nr:(2Fe-2S)-binding protein [Deltaproteobacteria bacterium]
MKQILEFTLNGSLVEVLVKPSDTLLDVLREQLGVTGPKRGCDSGDCGTCTVLINGKPLRSCLTIALAAAGKEVVTIEGVEKNGELDPLQKAFHEHGASQCGFCTSGMIVTAKALLEKSPNPSRDEIVEYMSGNLCRCGTYVEVIEAIQSVASDEGKE